MYLSRLTLNPRNATVFHALTDLYAMHQFLWRALPDQMPKQDDVHGPSTTHPLLYRVERADREGVVRVLAQSAVEPNWNFLAYDTNAVCEAETKNYHPQFIAGQWLRYRLRANPIVNKREEGQKRGARQGLIHEQDQAKWLVRQGERLGFQIPQWEDLENELHPDIRITLPGIVQGRKVVQMGTDIPRRRHTISLFSVDYEGLLQVVDPLLFDRAIRLGIGPAKGLGFGLLSVARVNV